MLNHARKTLSNKKQQDWSHFGGIEGGLDTIDKVKRLKPRSNILGVTPTLSLSLDWEYSYLFPVLLVSHKGPSKKELGQAPIYIF